MRGARPRVLRDHPWRAPALLAASLVAGAGALAAQSAQMSAQSAQVKGSTGVEVIFEVQTSADAPGGATNDQVTILFANTSSTLQKGPPRLTFDNDLMAEFSFSGREARPGSTLTFRRVLSTKTFLNARFIRIVNHGSDGWAGGTLSMTVDGQRLLDKVSLYPRKGASSREGIQKYNPVQWYERVYWEEDLQRLLRRRALY